MLIRNDSGSTHDFLAWLGRPGRCLHYSVGVTVTDDVAQATPRPSFRPQTGSGSPLMTPGQMRPGAWVAELTGLLDLADWPEGM